MKTDSLFYTLFRVLPEAFFELTGQPPEAAQGYQFTSVEIKQPTFRIDGIFKPPEGSPDKLLYFAEVQFQLKLDFYWGLFAEIFHYLEQEKPTVNWHAVAAFATRSLDPGVPLQHQALESQHLTRVYLDEMADKENPSLAMEMIDLIIAPERTAEVRARGLLGRVKKEQRLEAVKPEVVELIETILFYKFVRMSRQEIEAMFELTDLRQTRIYQEAKEEGKVEGKKEGKIEGKKEGKIEGKKEGKIEGKKEGRKEGKQAGKREGKLETVPLLLGLGLSVEQIATELGLDVRAVKKVAQKQAGS